MLGCCCNIMCVLIVLCRPFRFVGTNAYWLASLNTDADINKTIHDIASRGISVIRTWAFNGMWIAPLPPSSYISDLLWHF